MRLAMSISATPTRFAAMALQSNLEENISKVMQAGFDAVELSIRDPALIDQGNLEALLDRYNASVTAIGTGQAYLEEGISFTHEDASIRARALERVKSQVDLAARLGAKVIIGLIRGKYGGGVSEKKALEWLVESLQRCAGYAKDRGVELVLEPINRYETNLLNTVGECIRVIQAAGVSNLFVLPDTFHMNIEERNIITAIKDAGRYIGYFHAADSNRWAPGFGHLDFLKILQALRDTGYAGVVAVEIIPRPDPDTAVRQAAAFLREILGSRKD
ncbi:MAG: 5-keto-L-gluconate epimerase [Bacillota bacterium]